jgi:flagellar biosynthesis regulator FlaF
LTFATTNFWKKHAPLTMSQQLFAGNGRIGDNISSRMNGFRNQMTPFFIAGLFTAAGVMLAMGYNDVYGHLGTSYEAEKEVCAIVRQGGLNPTSEKVYYNPNHPAVCDAAGHTFSGGAQSDADQIIYATGVCQAADVVHCTIERVGDIVTAAPGSTYKCVTDPNMNPVTKNAGEIYGFDYIDICGLHCTYDKCMDHARETNTFHNTIFWITAAAMMGYYAVVVVNTLFYSDPPSTTAGKDLTFGNSALITLLQALVIFLNIFFVATTEQLYEHDDTTDNYDTHPATMVFWGWLIFIGYCSIASNQFEGGVMSTKVSGRVDASGKAKSAKAVRSIHW